MTERPVLSIIEGGYRKDVLEVLEEAVAKVKAGELEGIMIGYLYTDPTKQGDSQRAWGDNTPHVEARMIAVAAGLLHDCVQDAKHDF